MVACGKGARGQGGKVGGSVPLLLANVTQQLYQMARAAGLNKEDGLAVVKVLERLAGVEVKAR